MTGRRRRLVIGVAASCAAALISTAEHRAAAAELCVNAKGIKGCYTTINAGVAAAVPGDTIRVAQGAYREHVVINKPLSVIGADAANTIVDAAGPGNGIGIYVNGMDNLDPAGKLAGGTGLGDVVVQGFTVTNGGFEGILVTNAWNVTIVGNHVTGNNLNLQVPTNPAGCPFIPSWETSEGFDCGEGIHLAAVHNSTIANNIVDHNAGGILLTDETGANDENLITGNTVTDNGYDCGITLASHRPAVSQGFGSDPARAFGVYRNTVVGNEVSRNGLLVSGNGTGVGIFTSPGFPVAAPVYTAAYENVVIGNRIVGNGQPGVAMHAHRAGAILTGNLVTGNYIAGNGADVSDTTTNGASTGIIIHAGASGEPLTGNTVTGNVMEQESIDVAVSTSAQINVHLNSLKGGPVGVANLGSGTVDATMNWWGCPGGPASPLLIASSKTPTVSQAQGCSTVQGNVTYAPWLTQPSNSQ
jgi:parallel beta-helix repeat protein